MKLGPIMAKRREKAAEPPVREEPTARERFRKRQRRTALAANRAFVPLVGSWGAALGGLAVLVMPFSATARIALLTGLDRLGATAHYIVAALAALAGGALAFAIARLLSVRARRERGQTSIVSKARLRPIRPVEDLGSPNFDAPLETPLEPASPAPERPASQDPATADATDYGRVEDNAAEVGGAAPDREDETLGEDNPDRRANAIRRRLARALDEAEATDRSADEYGPADIAASEDAQENGAGEPAPDEDRVGDMTVYAKPMHSSEKPAELGLVEFGRLPGRNAVWLEGPLPDHLGANHGERTPRDAEPTGEAALQQPSPPALARSAALARLRATPTEELSLVQLVERLAAALHERQAADESRAPSAEAGGSQEHEGAAREAALAEAIRALGELAGAQGEADRGSPGKQSGGSEVRELAAALARLHDMRGAA